MCIALPCLPLSRNMHALASTSQRARPLCSNAEHVATASCFHPTGYATLSDAAQADVRRRLFRCGMAASLEHTLRLAYSAQDSSQQDSALKTVADILCSTGPMASDIITLGLAPMLRPAAASGDADSSCAAGQSLGSRSTGSSGGMAGAAGAAGGGPQHQLGLLLTLSKRSAMLTSKLEAVAPGGSAPGQGGGHEWTQVMELAVELLMQLVAVVESVEAEVRRRVAAAQPASSGSGGGYDTAAWEADAPCVDEAHEALALAVRAACNLAASWTWQLVTASGPVAGAGGSDHRLRAWRMAGGSVLRSAEALLVKCLRPPLLLSSAQLLACQPQRLLAAVCALAAALPAGEDERQRLGLGAIFMVLAMSARKALSERVRGWLAPAATASSSSTSSGGEEAGPSAGSLAGPLMSIIRDAYESPAWQPCAVQALALLKIASGEIRPKRGVPCCPGGRDATGEADGGFQQVAAVMADVVLGCMGNPLVMAMSQPLLPDGSSPMGLPPPPRTASTLPSSLPPPLVLPPVARGAKPQLRMCGNPQCGNFAERSEGALPFKQCGGCRVVRYCGADCQRAHWREGHREQCKELALGAAE